jgi:isopenicillin-N N-acyltransferase-like protein
MILELTGTARERGRQHGARLRAEIAHRLTTTPPAVLDPWMTAIRATPLYEELLGIAEGADRTIDEIVLLNTFEAIDPTAQPELGGCTLIAGDGIVAQNWDANESLGSTVGVHVHRGPDTPITVVLASPGGLGWVGMNEAGLALANSDLLTHATKPGIPSQVLRRLLLRTTSVAEALTVIDGTRPIGGRTYLLGDASGALRLVELAAEADRAVVLPTAPRPAHTNHALTPEVAQWQDADLLARIYPSTRNRLSRALVLLDDPAPLTPARAHTILTDHTHHPLSICRHTSPDEPTTTAASVLFDCTTRTATVTLGPPCTTRPLRFSATSRGTRP